MELEFVSNTGFYLSNQEHVFGMDLWFTQGAFEGSWYHFPPLRKTKYRIEDCDTIYISHIHPDHCDFNSLRYAKKDTVFVVPGYFNHLIKRKLEVFGFYNIVSLQHGEEATLPCGAHVRLYKQFVNNMGIDAKFGSLIDSALLIKWDGKVILNCNDNYIDLESAQEIKKEFNTIDLALLPHSASGPYPASFNNLSLDEKYLEADRLSNFYINHFLEMTETLQPRLVVPCAAEYVVVGRMWKKNDHIGLAYPKDAVDRWKAKAETHGCHTEAHHLDCGTILNLDTGKTYGLEPRNPSVKERMEFANKYKDVNFRYEWEDTCTSVEDLNVLILAARVNMWEMQKKLNWFKDYNVYINIEGLYLYHLNFSVEKIDNKIEERYTPYLEVRLSQQLMYSIITKKVHWNNAEGGLHLEFYREPNLYVPEVFILMSFFHAEKIQYK
ncbi:MAG: UDP-MurNAc hydroxylase [Enterobacterales bacterium]|jgi:UDP-MurNAc hydroxylase